MIKAAVKRFIIVLMLGLSPWALKAVDLPEEMKILADQCARFIGKQPVACPECPMDGNSPGTE